MPENNFFIINFLVFRPFTETNEQNNDDRGPSLQVFYPQSYFQSNNYFRVFELVLFCVLKIQPFLLFPYVIRSLHR